MLFHPYLFLFHCPKANLESKLQSKLNLPRGEGAANRAETARRSHRAARVADNASCRAAGCLAGCEEQSLRATGERDSQVGQRDVREPGEPGGVREQVDGTGQR